MEKRQITQLMKEEHRKINEALSQFLKNNDKGFFIIFKENIKKHFNLENETIFILVRKFTGKEIGKIQHLKKEHKEILNKIKEIKKNFPEKISNLTENPVIKELNMMIEDHIKDEEEIFYPRVDDMLDEQQKDMMIEEIRKMGLKI